MAKIKTITCHEVYNYGASLQEYALLKFLVNLGHEASAIHYKPSYLSGQFSLRSVSNPKFNRPFIRELYLLLKLPSRILALRRKWQFDDFHKKYVPTDSRLYKSNDELMADMPEADIFICGSDQIWNSYFQNGRDPAFYLNFVPENKGKFSYAASFAIDELEESYRDLVRNNLIRFDAISVRETSGVEILRKLGVNNAVQVLDPVFLLDIEDWHCFIEPFDEKYIFVYDFDNNSVIKELALGLKKVHGWKIYTVNRAIDYADNNFWFRGPELFLSLVAHSEFNITNSFHSIAFSLLFQKQFVAINRFEEINTRMRDLLSLLGLEYLLISSVEDFELFKEIDFRKLESVLNYLIEQSKLFVVQSISASQK